MTKHKRFCIGNAVFTGLSIGLLYLFTPQLSMGLSLYPQKRTAIGWVDFGGW